LLDENKLSNPGNLSISQKELIMAKQSLVSTTRAAIRESPKEIFNW